MPHEPNNSVSMAFVTDPIGIIGEEEAAKMLEAKGFKIMEHNWHLGHMEIDLIAETKKEVVLAEVKARTSTFGDLRPEEYVDEAKKRRMIIAGNAYVKQKRLNKALRFDIIGILVDPQTQEVTYRGHWENAFNPEARTTTAGSHSGQWNWFHREKRKRNTRK